MTTTVHSTPAHTITVERVGDVPELAPLSDLTIPWERVIVERLDGRFVCHHGAEFSISTWHGPSIEDSARALVVKLASRRETADYRYAEAPATVEVDPEPVATAPAYVLPSVGDNPAWERQILAATLRRTADAVDALPHLRVSPVNVRVALRKAAHTYRDGQAALELLVARDPWVDGWTGPRARVDVVANIRSVARCVEARAAVTR